VRTEGEADDLMFALQSADLEEAPSAISVSSAIVQLIDAHGISRKQIAETLGRSPAWITRMENLSRRLNVTVQKMVVEGYIQPRAAQEIARLPISAQPEFAASAGNEFLNKDEIMYLVNRYLDEDTGTEERDRIIRTPKLALSPDERKGRGRISRDDSDSARLSRAIARCIDSASCLSTLLSKTDIGAVAVRMSDVTILADTLAALHRQLKAVFTPG
jgi:ParB-like chromosome segregation protein Spo0J